MKSIIAATSIIALAAAAPLEARADVTVLPTKLSQYTYSAGAVAYNTGHGYVSRYPQNGGKDISTLVTFEVPAQYASNQCQLILSLNKPGSYASGSQMAQIFTSLKPATASKDTWPTGNLRDQNLGIIQAVTGSNATWVAGTGVAATNKGVFPCSELAAYVVGMEVTPVGDANTISWAGNDGLKIVVRL